MNVVTLNRGRIRCAITGDEALPAAAYAVVAELSKAVERANDELDEIDKALRDD